ncbi:keratinocyte-associated protein 3 [Amia ocellicauda]|uniref:keratinocyte-associated protein 3 n=1 Tax=Amia ocellicauda TaxID=2972642 RepID=UPI003463FEF1
MVNLGVCCADLEDEKSLMKMGLGLVLVGHVNFLLGGLVHGAVLRHMSLYEQSKTLEYAISNIIALVSGLVGVITGISAIVLSKNKKNRSLMWALLVLSVVSGLLSVASIVGLTLSVVKAILHEGQLLLSRCNTSTPLGYDTITHVCPFDPTRIYETTVILWVPLILMTVVALVFAFRCFHACLLFLELPCKTRKRKAGRPRRVQFQEKSSTSMPQSTADRMPEQHELLNRTRARDSWI